MGNLMQVLIAAANFIENEAEARHREMRRITDSDRFDVFVEEIQERVAALGHYQIFTTNADPQKLWEAYLDAAPYGHRQCRNCRACRNFIQKYGGLVCVNDAGAIIPLIWPTGSYQHLYEDAANAIRQIVNKADITGVWYSGEKILGTKDGGEWTHIWVENPQIYTSRIKTAEQAMAEKKQEYEMMNNAIVAYSRQTVEQALSILKSGGIDSKKHLEQIEWFSKVRIKGPNERWIAIASQPAGWAHIKSGMVGSLLDDLQAGKSFDSAKRSWDEKMHPLKYMRPQAPAKQGTIVQANRLVEQLEAQGSLKRRRARMEDLPANLLCWVPGAVQKVGFFDFGPQTIGGKERITFAKFKRDVLPNSNRIMVRVPDNGDFVALTTAEDPSAEPIFKWGHHIAWYRMHGGAYCRDFDARGGLYTRCIGIIDVKDLDRNYNDAFLLLEGANHTTSRGLGIFPQCLKSEFHGMRSVIEQYSNSGRLDRDSKSLAGLGLARTVDVQVHSNGVARNLVIDRYE